MYNKSEAQKRFLRKRHAQAKEEEVCCDCPGCESCRGFVRNCNCDHDLSWYRLRHEQQSNRQGMADQREGESFRTETPAHVDPEAYGEFGF